MKAHTSKRRGTVAVLVALTLTGLIGFVAIALDGGLLQDNRRSAQAAADASALAGAQAIYANYQAASGLDPAGTAAAKALEVAADNGYSNDGVHSKVTVNIPPLSGIHAGQAGYAEVLIEYYQTRFYGRDHSLSGLSVYLGLCEDHPPRRRATVPIPQNDQGHRRRRGVGAGAFKTRGFPSGTEGRFQ